MSSVEVGDGDDDLSDWKSVKLKFAPEPGKVSFIFFYVYGYISSSGILSTACGGSRRKFSDG